MAENFLPNECHYSLGKLEDVVYLIDKNAVKDIHIDNGEAYVSGIIQVPLVLKTYNTQLTETTSLNERYAFTHTLQFSVDGYMNKGDLDGKYCAMVKSKDDGGVWLINPEFPSKVTYTYTLDANGSRTDFTLSTISNIPMLRVVGFVGADAPSTCGYENTKIDTLRLNENNYSYFNGNEVICTNDGFKYVRFAKDSCVFTETFDGKNVSHKLTFSIPFSIYKSSWHYNLLEFPNNKYATIITTTDGKKVLCGFGFGLQPSYTVTANDSDAFDHIEITLQDLHDNGNLITILDDIVIEGDTTTSWRFISGYNGYISYECIGLYEAKYLLQQEVDILGNPTGQYKCLSGYEYRFQDLNIIGTFSETVVFECMECANLCDISTTLPSTIYFYSAGTQTFTINSESDWSISSNTAYITVSPLSGAGGSSTTLTVTNTATPTSASQTSQLGLVWCNEDKKRIVNVVVVASQSCFPQGKDYAINCQAQTLQVQTTCCISAVEDLSGNTSYIQINNNSISLTYGENSNSASSRSSLIKVSFCDGGDDYFTVTQDKTYVEWRGIGRRCDAGCYCEYEQLYSGTSSSAITTPIERYRKLDSTCTFSYACGDVREQWIPIAMRWYCMDGHTYKVEKKQIKKLCSSGPTILWEDTGELRLGDEVASPCPSGVTYDYRWNLTSYEACNGTNKYKLYQLERSSDSGSTWEDVVPSQLSVDAAGTESPIIVEADSLECGGSGGVIPQYREISGTPYCVVYDKYIDVTREVSYDSGTTWIEISSAATLIEVDSEDCGYVEPQYRTLSTATTCVSVDKYVLEEYQVSYDSGVTWATTGTSATTLIETDSYDCGYRTRTTSGTPYCSGETGFDKYEDILDQVSTDYGTTWTTTATTPTLIEIDSPDCGYVPTTSGKFILTLQDSTTVSAECDSTSAITYYEIAGYYDTTLVSAVVGDCVNTIGWGAFAVCTSLTSITIPSSVTSIGEQAFYGSSGLTSITIPNSVTNIGNDAFGYCDSLTSVTIPNSVISIGSYVFTYCTSLTAITCLATTPPTLESNAFDDTNDCPIFVPCGSLDAYKMAWSVYASRICGIPPCTLHRETSGTPYCDGVDKYIDVYHEESTDCGTTWITASTTPTLIETNSYDCGYRTRTTSGTPYCSGASGFDKYEDIYDQVSTDYGTTWTTTATTPTLIEINSEDCGYVPPTPTGAKYVLTLNDSSTVSAACDSSSEITKGDISSYKATVNAVIGNCVTTLGYECFMRYGNMTSITISNSVISIGTAAFGACSSLPSIIIPNTVAVMGTNVLAACRSLTAVTLPNTLRSINFGTFQNCSSLPSIEIPNSVVSIIDYAFDGCTSLSSITIPSGVTSISDFAFNGCTGLTAITCLATTPPSLGMHVFDSSTCPIYVPCGSVDAYKSAWSAYASRITCVQTTKFILTLNDSSTVSAACDFMTDITVIDVSEKYHDTLISAVINECITRIGDQAFQDCEILTSVTIPNSVTIIGRRAFLGCTSLSSITIPNSVTSIMEVAFNGCSSLTSVTIGNSVTSIGTSAFSGCSSLTSIEIPSNVTTIGENAFCYCTSLSSITIPNSVTSIGDLAFEACSGATSLTIGSGVTSIGTWAFDYCISLASITVNAITPPTLGTDVFEGSTCPIYVPSESVNTYKAASGWSAYASRIQPIP